MLHVHVYGIVSYQNSSKVETACTHQEISASEGPHDLVVVSILHMLQ